ncbi:nuclear transport factor 2 family protein [Actinomycetospora straminea]|uniref:SnoaL-like domain-containing protein n=1 Tax=Actinomycetospora straminea TaxID=663607 RepID=A0ABP9EEA0_9PSEU|nr:nuclear transport factor 2 family protein [Actinomycetospora straminea]MDD7932256.1 nuclear transport factor 2 family protein [Actinomycetospora straminea]
MSATPPAVERYFAAVNAEDWDTIRAVFAEGAELRTVGAPTRRGRDEIAAHFPQVLAALPVHHDQVTRVVVADRTVLVEIHFTGRTAADAPVEFDAVDVFDLGEDGTTIEALSTWYDTAGVARQVRA